MSGKYGKLENGVLIFAPSNLIIDNEQVFNAAEAEYLAAGYLPIEYTSKPDDGEWQPVYTEIDGRVLQSWVYKGRVHDHSNLPLLEDVTAKSLSGVPAVHILPIDAKDGDLCLYAPMNSLTLAESGKRIYFDWEKFGQPVDEGIDEDKTTALGAQLIGNAGEENVQLSINRNGFDCVCFIEDYSTGVIFQAAFNSGALDFASYGDTVYNSVEEIPSYYQLPQFDTIDIYNFSGNEYLFHTEYHLMKYQGGEWVEAVEKGISQADMEAYVTSAINGSLDEIEALIDESGVLE